MAAWEAGDVDAIVAMLTEDARYSMPPLRVWYAGHDGIRRFLDDAVRRHRWRFLPARANGQLAFGTYLWNDERGAYVPAGLDVLALRGRGWPRWCRSSTPTSPPSGCRSGCPDRPLRPRDDFPRRPGL